MISIDRYPVTIDGVPCYAVRASDYERDMQALKERADAEQEAYDGQRRILDSVKAERDTFKFECVNLNNILDQIRTERDALRVQVEAMRALLVDAHWTVHLPTTEHAIIPRCRCRKCVISRIDAALQANP